MSFTLRPWAAKSPLPARERVSAHHYLSHWGPSNCPDPRPRPPPTPKRTAVSLCLELLMICLFVLAGLWAVGLTLSPRTSEFTDRPHVPRRGGVASLDARCSRVGSKILESLGNAADAVRGAIKPIITRHADVLDDCHSIVFGCNRWLHPDSASLLLYIDRFQACT